MMSLASPFAEKIRMKEFSRLVRIMKKLRHPRRGCPWDLQQTPESLKEYILEEAHELIEAIDSGDAEAVREDRKSVV
jgi:uncharacterized protein YabN with tetrapyrrole methylase and pyrophosphatase domain